MTVIRVVIPLVAFAHPFGHPVSFILLAGIPAPALLPAAFAIPVPAGPQVIIALPVTALTPIAFAECALAAPSAFTRAVATLLAAIAIAALLIIIAAILAALTSTITRSALLSAPAGAPFIPGLVFHFVLAAAAGSARTSLARFLTELSAIALVPA